MYLQSKFFKNIWLFFAAISSISSEIPDSYFGNRKQQIFCLPKCYTCEIFITECACSVQASVSLY